MKLLKDLGPQYPKSTSKTKTRYGIFECSKCFSEVKTSFSNAKKSKTNMCQSCSKKTHEKSKDLLYYVWKGQKNRCNNPKSRSYDNYGSRGITFSEEFLDFSVWLEYVQSLQNYGVINFTLDREDNNKGYERGNLRWASCSVQNKNTRKPKNNTSGYKGVSKSGKNWKAYIKDGPKVTHLGTFKSKELAAKAYNDYIDLHKSAHIKNEIKEIL